MAIDRKSLAVLAAGLMLVAPAFAEEVKQEGVIVSHSGQTYSVRTRTGQINVVVSGATKIREVSGLSKKTMGEKSLIHGLIIKVEGEQQGDTIHASEIDYKKNDWRAAIASKAGTQEEFATAAAERAELRKAIIEGQEYVVQDEVTVYFPTGSAVVGESYKAALRQLAQKAPSFGNYRISVTGYADSRGNPDANERLSLKRAMAVSMFVRQTGHIQPGRVLSPTAMGEGAVAPDDKVPASLDEARRVVVRTVTPKGQLTK